MHQGIYEELKRVASAGRTTYYSDVAPLAGLDMSLQEHRTRIGTLLDEISRFEHDQGRPLLSVVVVQKGENMPSKGFFKLARSLALPGTADTVVFYLSELKRTHEAWKASRPVAGD